MTLVIVALIAILAVFSTLISCSNDAPTISISEDGYWVINGEKTDVSAKGEKGDGSSSANENPQGLQFYPQDDGTYIVSCGDAKYLSNIVIPATYKGSAVVGIDNSAFSNCTNLKSIVIPDSVTSIGNEAFYDCDGRTGVVIPNSVTSIGNEAFYDCDGLTSIVIPYSVTSIGSAAFNGCSSLTSVAIPDSVTSISSGAFAGCTGLTSIVIPDSMTSIYDGAFWGCSSLESVVIPDSVTSIYWYAFDDCIGLTDVYYTGTEAEWAKISIDSTNSYLTTATIHYNYVPEN